MEVLADFAGDLPLWTMCRFIGIDDEDRESMSKFLVGNEEGFASPMTPERRKRSEDSIVALNNYIADLISRRREAPREDVVTQVIAEQERVDGPTDRELVSLLVNIIGGSIGSTKAAFSNAIYEFARHPDQADIVRKDESAVPKAVEEAVRYTILRSASGRRVVAKATSNVRSTTSRKANRSSSRGRPTIAILNGSKIRTTSMSYDPRSATSVSALARTSRLGQAVARTNLQEGLKVFLQRCDNIELVEEPVRVPFTVDEQIEALKIRFDAKPR